MTKSKLDVECANCGGHFKATQARFKAHPYCGRPACIQQREDAKPCNSPKPHLAGCQWRNISADPTTVRWAPFLNGVQVSKGDGKPLTLRPDDERLAELTDAQRELALEFLSLHEARDTPFRVRGTPSGGFQLLWSVEEISPTTPSLLVEWIPARGNLPANWMAHSAVVVPLEAVHYRSSRRVPHFVGLRELMEHFRVAEVVA